MYLTPISVLKERLARRWCKMQSQRGPYIYEMQEKDKRVINNKPHIKLERVNMPQAMSPYGMLSPLLGVVRSSPPEEDDWEEPT